MVTAAHCVYDINDSHQYVDSLDFKPALSGASAPFGTLRWKTARVLSQFTSQVGPHADGSAFGSWCDQDAGGGAICWIRHTSARLAELNMMSCLVLWSRMLVGQLWCQLQPCV